MSLSPRITGLSRFRLPMLPLALALSLLAGASVYYAVAVLQAPVPVVVAARDIEALRPIRPADLKVVHVARRDRHPQAFADPARLAGTFSAAPIYRGQQVIAPQVATSQDQLVLQATTVAAGDTLLTLREQDAAWPSLLQPGDVVSVVAVYLADPAPGTSGGAAQVLDLGTARVVAAAGGSLLRTVESLRAAQATAPGREITLALPVETAKRVLAATKQAKGVYLLPQRSATGGK